ncbi:zinc finger family protein [Hibiscus syriacus]|uniref:Zinc finger family protein n=1 Tax=Hibiscus syriacus TaxID=106335 RepID=A0A6A3A1S2_HIBSY|nr:zinc finger family protein [Hibiscus syriacus]
MEGRGEVLAPPERQGDSLISEITGALNCSLPVLWIKVYFWTISDKCMFSSLQLTSTKSGSFPEMRIKLAPGKENDMLQLRWFCDACKGIPQARIPAFLHNSHPPAAPATAPPDAEDLELAVAINASIQSAIAETSDYDLHSANETSASAGWNSSASTSNHNGSVAPTTFPPSKASISEWDMIEAGSGSDSTEGTEIHNNDISAIHTTMQTSDSVPSAPQAPAMDEIVEDGRFNIHRLIPLLSICLPRTAKPYILVLVKQNKMNLLHVKYVWMHHRKQPAFLAAMSQDVCLA